MNGASCAMASAGHSRDVSGGSEEVGGLAPQTMLALVMQRCTVSRCKCINGHRRRQGLNRTDFCLLKCRRETQGRTSEIVGTWMKGRSRSSLVVASKVTMSRAPFQLCDWHESSGSPGWHICCCLIVFLCLPGCWVLCSTAMVGSLSSPLLGSMNAHSQ